MLARAVATRVATGAQRWGTRATDAVPSSYRGGAVPTLRPAAALTAPRVGGQGSQTGSALRISTLFAPYQHSILQKYPAIIDVFGKIRPDIWFIYYEEGNPRVSVAPDVFVVFGVEKRERLNYKLWEEGRAPSFVLEVASPSTWREDLGRKRSVYARLGVREYWQYDPLGAHLPARLQGERLTRSGYVRQPTATAPDGMLTLRSETLGLELRAAPGREMRFRDPVTGSDLRSHGEEAEDRARAEARAAAEARDRATEAAARLAAETRAAAAETRAAAAETRVAALEALLRKRSH